MLRSSIGAVNPITPTPKDGARADQLQQCLARRLQLHKESRLDKPQRTHWCLQWFSQNLGVLAAVAVLNNHVVRDLTHADDKVSLLTCVPTRWLDAAPHAQLSGTYIHFDDEAVRVVRSGKAVRTDGIGGREKDHKKAARCLTSETAKSKFYSTYPTTATEDGGSSWGDLRQCVAFAFDMRDKEKTNVICASERSKGILVWPKLDRKSINEIKFAGASTLEAKQLHMVGYLFELGYDLMIAPSANVSESAGFETPLGIFGS